MSDLLRSAQLRTSLIILKSNLRSCAYIHGHYNIIQTARARSARLQQHAEARNTLTDKHALTIHVPGKSVRVTLGFDEGDYVFL